MDSVRITEGNGGVRSFYKRVGPPSFYRTLATSYLTSNTQLTSSVNSETAFREVIASIAYFRTNAHNKSLIKK